MAALVYIPMLVLFLLYQQVLPGREGLVFDSALSMGLLPSLCIALLVTINSIHHHPGKPGLSLFFAACCFFIALGLSFIYPSELNWTPPTLPRVNSGELYTDGSSGIIMEKFENGRLFNLVVKRPELGVGKTLTHYPWGDFDSLNNQVLFPDGTPSFPIPTDIQEVNYFSPPEILIGIFSDINFLYELLANSWKSGFNAFILLAVLLTGLFTGLTVLMHFKIWPLIKWAMLLIGLRGIFFFIRFSFHDAVYMVSRWSSETWILTILPYIMLFLAAGFLLNIALIKLPFQQSGDKKNA